MLESKYIQSTMNKLFLLFISLLFLISILAIGSNTAPKTYSTQAATLFSSDDTSSSIHPQILNVVISQTTGTLSIDDVKKGIGIITPDNSPAADYTLLLLDSNKNILATQPFELHDRIIMEGATQRTISGGHYKPETTSVLVTLPYRTDVDLLEVRDKKNTVLAAKHINNLKTFSLPDVKGVSVETPATFNSVMSRLINDIGKIKTNIVKGYVNQDLGKENTTARHVKIAFLSDGFPKSDMGTFHKDVERNMRYLLNYIEPYKSRADQIQYFSVDNTEDIGCQMETDTVEIGGQMQPTQIMVCDTAKITQRVQQAGQPWDVIVLITRRDLGRYSSYPWAHIATIGTGFNMEQIFAHEFGHAFADLEDEYVYTESDTGPEDNQIHQNCLHSSNPALWNNIVPEADIKAGCSFKNYFRPSNQSIMNNHLDADYYNAPSQNVIVHTLDQVAGKSSDVTPPSIKLNINQNQTVTGIFNVIGEANDDRGTMRVEFYIDNTLFHTSYTAPHSFEWNSSSFSNGEHTIYAKAYDASDNSASTPTVTFTIQNAQKVPDSATNALPDYRNWGILLFHKLQDILK